MDSCYARLACSIIPRRQGSLGGHMRSFAPALLFAYAMGCGGPTPAPTPTPKPNPAPGDAGDDPLTSLCTPLDLHRVVLPGIPVQLTLSNQFTAIAFGAPTQG